MEMAMQAPPQQAPSQASWVTWHSQGDSELRSAIIRQGEWSTHVCMGQQTTLIIGQGRWLTCWGTSGACPVACEPQKGRFCRAATVQRKQAALHKDLFLLGTCAGVAG
jgi:hypothetical protein